MQALKQRYWAEQHRVFGPARAVQVSQALWRYMRRLRPDWPTAHDRAQDLAHHIELKRKIDQAAHALAQSDLLPAFEQALRRAHTRAK